MDNLYVGTSGWAYKEWKPDFYPQELPQTRFLEHYCSALGACEINATFYRRQAPETFDKWASATPEGFRFATKAHRVLTHARSFEFDERRRSWLGDFLGSVARLGPRLGAVLFQFPPYRRRNDDALRVLLDALGGTVPAAFEFRHESWGGDDVAKLIADGGGTVCVSNTDGIAPEALPPGPLAYIRLRTDRYSPEQRAAWLELLRREARDRPVFAFAKHEGIPTEDPFGGVGLARWLVQQTRS